MCVRCIHVCICLYICICECKYIYACVCVYIYKCICKKIYVKNSFPENDDSSGVKSAMF